MIRGGQTDAGEEDKFIYLALDLDFDLEVAAVVDAVPKGAPADGQPLRPVPENDLFGESTDSTGKQP
jgi:hypothetical protein